MNLPSFLNQSINKSKLNYHSASHTCYCSTESECVKTKRKRKTQAKIHTQIFLLFFFATTRTALIGCWVLDLECSADRPLDSAAGCTILLLLTLLSFINELQSGAGVWMPVLRKRERRRITQHWLHHCPTVGWSGTVALHCPLQSSRGIGCFTMNKSNVFPFKQLPLFEQSQLLCL